jgi:hypothetical protein
MRAWSRDQKSKRDLARAALIVGAVFLIFALIISGRDFDWAIVRLFLYVWGLPSIWAIVVMFSTKDSVLINLDRGAVIVSGHGLFHRSRQLRHVLARGAGRRVASRLGCARERGSRQSEVT